MKKIISSRIVLIASKAVLWLGIVIILTSVGCAIFNLSDIENFIAIWAASMAVGVCFSLISVLLHRMIKSSDKKEYPFVN